MLKEKKIETGFVFNSSLQFLAHSRLVVKEDWLKDVLLKQPN